MGCRCGWEFFVEVHVRSLVCLWGCVGLAWNPAVAGCEWIDCGWSCCACIGGDGGVLLRVAVFVVLSVAVFGVLSAAFDVMLSVVERILYGGAGFGWTLICGWHGVGRVGCEADGCATVCFVAHPCCGWAAAWGWVGHWLWQ